jgi:hypothetical protein
LWRLDGFWAEQVCLPVPAPHLPQDWRTSTAASHRIASHRIASPHRIASHLGRD